MAPESFQLPPAFGSNDVIALLSRLSSMKVRGLNIDSFQLTLLISVVNAVLARYKVPLRLMSVIT